MELSIDTSSSIASLALSRDESVLAELTWRCGQNHSVELIPSIDKLMDMVKVERSSLTGVIVAKGPGSFNGLRVGIATAKGLAYALNIPVVGISTLEVEAFPHLTAGLPVCPVHNAGRGEIAVALFQQQGDRRIRLREEQITTINELAERISQTTIFCGEYSLESASVLKDKLGSKALLISKASTLRRAGFLAELGWTRLKKGDWDDPAILQPLYLRQPPITTPKSRSGVNG